MEITDSCASHNVKLGYLSGTRTASVPEWARFFIDLGFALGQRPPDEARKLVVGLALPTRAYAAALIAMGIICARSSIEAAARDNTEYFTFLRQQNDGTPVRFFRGGRIFKGELDSSAATNGREQIVVKYRSDGRLTCWRNFDLSDCTAVEVCPDRPDLAHRQRGYAVVQYPQFVEKAVGKRAAERFCFTSRLDCLFVGSVGRIGEELFENFGVLDAGDIWIPGILQDVVRAKRFFTGGQAFRSTVLPAASRASPFAGLTEVPPFVIFDSAAGCVKWHYEARKSHHVVLLDRSDRLFDDAATNLTTRFYQRAGDADDLGISGCPAAIEPIVFLEKI
jgi:hypothetical protein